MTNGTGTRSYAMAASWDIGVVKKTEVVIVKWSFVDEGQGRLHPFWPWSELGTILADVDLRRLQGRAVISIPWAGSVDTFSESLPSNTNNEQLYMAHLAYEMLWVSLIERASNLGVTVVAPATSDVGRPWPISSSFLAPPARQPRKLQLTRHRPLRLVLYARRTRSRGGFASRGGNVNIPRPSAEGPSNP